MRPKCFLYVGRFSCNDDSNSATGWIRSFKLMGMRGKIKRERGRDSADFLVAYKWSELV